MAMDSISSSLIGNAQDAMMAGLQARVASNAATAGKIPGIDANELKLKQTRETAKEFEGFFIGQMMEYMMAGIETDPMFGGGPGEDMWRSLLNQEYGKEIAKSGKLGIADHVMRGMLQAQEERDAQAQNAAPAPAPAAATQTPSEALQTTQQTTGAVPAASAFMPIRR